jgi:hypothetical protein
MNWRIEKACAIAVDVYDRGKMTSVMASLTAHALDRFAIGLCLLEQRLIDSLDLVDVKGKDVLRMQNSQDEVPVQFLPGKIIVALDPVRLLYFTLCAVRDGMAPVDHRDLELTHHPHDRVDLCVKYPVVGPPVPPEEVRRRLGL